MYILSYVQKELLLRDISKTLERLENRMDTSLKIMDNKQDISTKDNPVSHDEVDLSDLDPEIFPTPQNDDVEFDFDDAIYDNTQTEIIDISNLDENTTSITSVDNGLYPF